MAVAAMAALGACGTSAPSVTPVPTGAVASIPAAAFVHPDGLFRIAFPDGWGGRLLEGFSSPGFIETWAFASEAVLDGRAAEVDSSEPFALVGMTVLWLASSNASSAQEFSNRIVQRSRANRDNVSVFLIEWEPTAAVSGYDGYEATIERRTTLGITLIEVCRHLVEQDGPAGYEVCTRAEQRYWPGIEPELRSLLASFEPLPRF